MIASGAPTVSGGVSGQAQVVRRVLGGEGGGGGRGLESMTTAADRSSKPGGITLGWDGVAWVGVRWGEMGLRWGKMGLVE